MATALGDTGQVLRHTQSEWDRLATRARWSQRAKVSAIYAFLIVVSLPVILPYFWLVTIAFSARTGIAETFVLWRSVLVLMPAVLAFWIWSLLARSMRQMVMGSVIDRDRGAVPFLILVGPELHLNNFIFYGRARFRRSSSGRAEARSRAVSNFPTSGWPSANSLYLAGGQTIIVANDGIARRLLSVALPVPGARRDAAIAPGAARVSGADADRAVVPDPVLCRPAR